MGLSQALFSGISGLSNHQRRMDNIGNNLANVNTVGFKKGVHQFHTLLSQRLRGGTAPTGTRGGINPLQVGLGANTSSVNQEFTQGSMQVTGNERDMAVEGNGFFVMRIGDQGGGEYAYTRDGAFYLGTDGTLLGGEGLAVQGIAAEEGVIPASGSVSDLVIPIGSTGAAAETTNVAMTGNLNSDVVVANANVVTTAAAAPANNTDSTWVTGNASSINIGHVETSEGLYDAVAAAPATAATTLGNLQYLKAGSLVSPFTGIGTGDQVTINWRKGGRKMSATFTYGENDPTAGSPPLAVAGVPDGDGTTLRDLMAFMTGGWNDDSNAALAERLRGGAMGTLHTRERTLALDGYDVAAEHAGAFFRQYVGGVAPHVGAVDYDADGALDNTNRVSIASNLGEENAITDIEFAFNNITYSDMFAADSDSQLGAIDGGSTTTTMVAYDSLGNAKQVTIQMALVSRDTNFSTWRWMADSTEDTDASWLFPDTDGNPRYNEDLSQNPITNVNVGTGTIRFDQEGRYVRGTELSATGGVLIDLDGQGVEEPLEVKIVEGLSPTLDQDLDFSDLTQVAADSDFNLKEQNGSPPGTLDSFTVTSDGVINGVFSNGVLESLGRISLALVPNEVGLVQAGQNLYLEGSNSGEPQIGFADVGGRGVIRSGALELSNVDLSEEFTNLIVTERGFQANARVITTSDEMLVELVNLKR